MAEITKDMVNNLNAALTEKGCGFEYVYVDSENENLIKCIKRTVIDKTGFVESSVINCTKSFYEWLDAWFRDNYNIELDYNNTGNICWPK